MIKKDFTLEYSQPWLGRPFIFSEKSIAWGRYIITDSNLAAAADKKSSHLKFTIKQAAPEQLGIIFENLLHISCPESLPDFRREIQALATYHYALDHRRALLRKGCTSEDYYRANIAVVSAFDNALSAVFESSTTLHGLNHLKYIRYRQKLHGVHLATFANYEHAYDVAFTRELVLDSIHRDSDWSRTWPSFD